MGSYLTIEYSSKLLERLTELSISDIPWDVLYKDTSVLSEFVGVLF